LITRLLAVLPENLVLSEPEPLNALLLPHPMLPRMPAAQRIEWLQGMMSALGQRRSGVEQRLFVKFDPSDVAELPLLRQAFPGVPEIFVYRDPLEVLVSNVQRPAIFVTPGMLRISVPGLEGAQSEEEYTARALAAVLELAAEQLPGSGTLLVNYSQLPMDIWGGIAQHFGLHLDEAEIARMRDAAAFDAKRPGRKFLPDGSAKSQDATPSLRELAEKFLAAPYQRLEAARHKSRHK
jgi:hypothetical protein